MANFCKQCSISLFSKDYGDMAGITTPEEWAQGLAVWVICEGCGFVQVGPDGSCVSPGCMRGHVKAQPKMSTGVPKRST